MDKRQTTREHQKNWELFPVDDRSIITHCPSCSNKKLICHGPIACDLVFAGKELPKPILGGELFECLSCHLYFRSPQLSKDRLDKLYATTGTDVWDISLEDRMDWQLAIQHIKRRIPRGNQILDVGCYDGAFLSNLIGYDCYGIEINRRAFQISQCKGITLACDNTSKLRSHSELYNVITAFDLIEHLRNPLFFVRDLNRILKPGGIIIISTGNADAWSWKLMGSRYYYCSLPEHVSFLNPRWVDWSAKELGLFVEEIIFFTHKTSPLRVKVKQLGKNMLYKFWPKLAAELRMCGFGKKNVNIYPDLKDAPPAWDSAKDHMICVLSKRS